MVVSPPLEVKHAIEVFSVIEPFLTDLFERFGGDKPSDIADHLASGKYKLHPFGNEGFLISYLDDSEFHVVTAYAYRGSLKYGIFDALNAMMAYARKCGAVQLSFTSPRMAWRRIARKAGFTITDTFFYRMLY